MKKQQKLLDMLNARSEHALEELTNAYGGLCRSIAGNILASCEDVEETVSDTMLTVWNRIPPEQPENLTAYISRITRNNALNKLKSNTAGIRDERMTVCLSELECCLPSPDTVESRLESALITQTINRFLSTLSKTNRSIFIRRYYCMDTTREIAASLGLTELAVRSRLLRMREHLRKELEKEGIYV